MPRGPLRLEPRTVRRTTAALAALCPAALLSGLTAACDVEWGGAELRIEEPRADRPGDTVSREGDGETAVEAPALPTPPLLYLAELGSDGAARAVPVARLGPEGPRPLDWPENPDPRYRDRFDSAFLAPGTELVLHSAGGAPGRLILGEEPGTVNAACPGVAAGRALLLAGTRTPPHVLAVGPGAGADLPAAGSRPAPTRRNRLFAPILAERILQEQGVERAFLARRVALEAVHLDGDTVPGMAATYLVNDSLSASPPPSGPSASLAFLAQYDPAEGFVPVWSAVRSYAEPADKEAFAFVDWVALPAGRLLVMRRFGTRDVRLATVDLEAEGRDAIWIEPGGCPAFDLLAGTGRSAGIGQGSP